MRIAACVLVLALVPLSASAQMTEPMVHDGMFANYDLDALKGGEWVEYEMTSEIASGSAPARTTVMGWRTACVGVEADTVWFETTQGLQPNPAWKGTVLLIAVDRKTGKPAKAWWGKPGETGKELKVTTLPASTSKSEFSGTGKVTREAITAAGVEYDCEKTEVELTANTGKAETKSKTTSWSSEKLPLSMKIPAPGGKETDPKITWEGKPSGKGFVVKTVAETRGGGIDFRSTMTLVLKGCGRDAKATLKK